MRILIAGATGVVGQRLVPFLTEAGHDVVGTTRTPTKIQALERAGATAAVMNALDPSSVQRVMADAKPDVVVHQLTELGGHFDLRKLDATFAGTNALRTKGTDNLLAAVQAVGVTRFVAQSYTGWPNARSGGLKTEEDPLDPDPPPAALQTITAIKHVEEVVPNAEGLDGLVLRYGAFYGPGTSIGAGGELSELVRARKLPLIGDGSGVWSFVQIDDAARATAAAIERGDPGLYNVVDDEPAPVAEWLPVLAQAVGGRPPRRLPVWLARMAVGDVGIAMMTQSRGSANDKAKRELDWRPEWPSWRQGFIAAARG